jgi:hypothetical protein
MEAGTETWPPRKIFTRIFMLMKACHEALAKLPGFDQRPSRSKSRTRARAAPRASSALPAPIPARAAGRIARRDQR